MPDAPPDVFISYAQEDRALTTELVAGLRAKGFTPWTFEENSGVGQDYLDEGIRAIRRARSFLLVISPTSIGSNEVDLEVKAAHRLQKPIIPLLYGVSPEQFLDQKPSWWAVVGSRVYCEVPSSGVAGVLPAVVRRLEQLEVSPYLPPPEKPVTPPEALEERARVEPPKSAPFKPSPSKALSFPGRLQTRIVSVVLLVTTARDLWYVFKLATRSVHNFDEFLWLTAYLLQTAVGIFALVMARRALRKQPGSIARLTSATLGLALLTAARILLSFALLGSRGLSIVDMIVANLTYPLSLLYSFALLSGLYLWLRRVPQES
jgi:TIR domain-containing protein